LYSSESAVRYKFNLIKIKALGVTKVHEYCDGTLDLTKLGARFNGVLDGIKDFETKFATTPSKYLCTDTCPCPPSTSTSNWLSKFTSAKSYEAQYATFTARAASAKFNRNFTITTSLTEY